MFSWLGLNFLGGFRKAGLVIAGIGLAILGVFMAGRRDALQGQKSAEAKADLKRRKRVDEAVREAEGDISGADSADLDQQLRDLDGYRD